MQCFIQNEIRAMQSFLFCEWSDIPSTLRMWLCNNLKWISGKTSVGQLIFHYTSEDTERWQIPVKRTSKLPHTGHWSQRELPFSSACQPECVLCCQACLHGTFPEWVSGPVTNGGSERRLGVLFMEGKPKCGLVQGVKPLWRSHLGQSQSAPYSLGSCYKTTSVFSLKGCLQINAF